MQPLVYFIHGTWPNGPFRAVKPGHRENWFSDSASSEMAWHVLDKVPTACIKSFYWSGANSHGARIRAADELVSRIVSDYKSGQYGSVSFVAHSHGGTVLLHALYHRFSELQAQGIDVRKVVCLATPFVYLRRLDEGREVVPNAVYANTLVTLFVAIVFHYWPSLLTVPWYFFAYGCFIVHRLCFIVGGMTRSMIGDVVDVLPKRPPGLPVFDCVRAHADEASGLLAFSSFLNWLASMLLMQNDLIYNWDTNKRGFGLVVSVAAGVVFTSLMVLGTMMMLTVVAPEVHLLPVANWVIVAILLSVALPTAVVLVTYLLNAVLCGQLRPWIWGAVSVEMEQTPPGSGSMVHLVHYDQVRAGGSSHSLHSWSTVHRLVGELLQPLNLPLKHNDQQVPSGAA